MKYYARIGDRVYECMLEAQNGEIFVEVEGTRYRADLTHIPRSSAYSLLLDGRSYEFALDPGPDAVELSGAAGLFHVCVEDARTFAARKKTASAAAGTARAHTVKAVMPGIVRDVCVENGASVEQGQPLVILEAMKMQNEIRADRSGTVETVHVAVGDTVEKGQKLVDFR